MHHYTEVTDVQLNELLKANSKNDKAEQPGDPTIYTPKQKRIY